RAAADKLRGRGPMPAPSRRRRGIKIAAVALIALLVVGGAILGVRSIYFLGTDGDGQVALYRGLPYELPLGLNLYSQQRSIGVQETTLTEQRQRAVTGHELRSKSDATDLIDNIEQTSQPPAPAPAATPPATPPANKKKQQQATAAQQKSAQKR